MLNEDSVDFLKTECPPDQPGGLGTATDNILQRISVGVDEFRSTDQVRLEFSKCEIDGISLNFDNRPVALSWGQF